MNACFCCVRFSFFRTKSRDWDVKPQLNQRVCGILSPPSQAACRYSGQPIVAFSIGERLGDISFKREQQHLPQSLLVDTIAAAAGVRARQTAVAWWQRDLHVIYAIETQQVIARCHIRIVGGVAQW